MVGKFGSGRYKVINMEDQVVVDQVEIFGKLCATQREMASHFDVTMRTIENYMADHEGGFYRTYAQAAAVTKTSLRRVQISKAMDGDNTMMVWMGKQLLDQKEKVEEKIDTTQRIVVIDSDDAKL